MTYVRAFGIAASAALGVAAGAVAFAWFIDPYKRAIELARMGGA